MFELWRVVHNGFPVENKTWYLIHFPIDANATQNGWLLQSSQKLWNLKFHEKARIQYSLKGWFTCFVESYYFLFFQGLWFLIDIVFTTKDIFHFIFL